jgi:hemerythrin-like domain-containing protein
MLRTHIYKEDNILFEMIDDTLSAEDDSRVLHGFEGFDRDFTARGYDKILHRLRMLEWKYLSKVA